MKIADLLKRVLRRLVTPAENTMVLNITDKDKDKVDAFDAFQREWQEKISKPSTALVTQNVFSPIIDAPRRDSIQVAFEKFHAENPLVFQLLVSNALRIKAKGYQQYGIKTLFELVRWHYDTNIGSGESYRLNNNYTSRYARLIMDKVPQLRGFFKLREHA